MNPWNVQETILDTGRTSALALERWEQALDLNTEITTIEQRRGASAHESARTRFNNYGPLLRLGRLTETDHLLRECQEVFETAGDITALGDVYSACADLEDTRGHPQDASDLQRTALRLSYTRPNPRSILLSHHNLANYLSRGRTDPGEQRAHRLVAALITRLTGDTHEHARTLRQLARELRADAARPEAPALPTTLSEVIGLVDAGEGMRFSELITALCPDPATAEHALTELLTTAAALPDQPAQNTIEHHLAQWEPIITAVIAAATNGHTPTDLTDALDEHGASTDWAALVTALRRVLAGDRDPDQLSTGLDEIDTAILITVLDRLPHHPSQNT